MKTVHRFLKFSVCLCLIGLFVSDAMASRRWGRYPKSTTLKFGYYNPKGAKGGASFGLNLSNGIDEVIDLGFGVDLYYRSYKRDSKFATVVIGGEFEESQIKREMEFITTAIPVMGTILVKLNADMPFSYFVGGGLGYALISNFAPPCSITKCIPFGPCVSTLYT